MEKVYIYDFKGKKGNLLMTTQFYWKIMIFLPIIFLLRILSMGNVSPYNVLLKSIFSQFFIFNLILWNTFILKSILWLFVNVFFSGNFYVDKRQYSS